MIVQRQFGVWMDTHHATVVGNESTGPAELRVIAQIKGKETTQNSSEKNQNNEKQTLLAKFFKEITLHLQNATLLHITGTGQVQEQFIHYLANTPQFKYTKTEESTSNKMNDEKLIAFMSTKIS